MGYDLNMLMWLLSCAEPDGEVLYQDYCGLCHGVSGEGYDADRANALNNPEFLASASDTFLVESTRLGRPGTSMSAWSVDALGPLDDAQIDAIVARMRQWQTLEPVEVDSVVVSGDAAAGAQLYAEQCAVCHGADGEGASALSLSNPEFLAIASDGFIRYGIAAGRSGTAMMAYADVLQDAQIDDLVAFIRDWE